MTSNQPPISSFETPVNPLLARGVLYPPPRLGMLAKMGSYEIMRELGAGAMGVVFLARHRTQAKRLAIKLMRPELASNAECAKRFSVEAYHLQRLKHSHIIPVLEISDRAEMPFFVMPYMEQGSLAQRIRPGQPLADERILRWARQIAEALNYAHMQGVLHRDLKPSNILIDAGGRAFLADFGLARTTLRDGEVNHGRREGTVPYMSPALAAGGPEGGGGDIYAFGALLYEMLTGTPPYQGSSAAAILKQISAGPPTPILSKNPQATSGLVRIAESAMARSHFDRYCAMSRVVADLERVESGQAPLGS